MSPMVIAVMAGASVAILVLALFRGNRDTGVHRRLERLGTDDETVDVFELSFGERVIAPLLGNVGNLGSSMLPARVVESIDSNLETAGRPMSLSAFLTIWAGAGVALPLGFGLLNVISTGTVSQGLAAILAVWAGAGIYLPWMLLRRKAMQRSEQIAKELPDAIDLIVTNIEAGLGLQAALLAVAEKFKGPIAEEFGRAVNEISVGIVREEALLSMARRSKAREMFLFARAIAQAEQTGIPIAGVLRNHAAESRERRRQEAQEKAAKIPVKITLPTVLFMFPTLFLLLLGPIGLDVMDTFG
jgi:tight adherence protein C